VGTSKAVLAIAVIYLLIGVLGFVPGVVRPTAGEYGALLGLVPVNAAVNLLHLATGLWGWTASMAEDRARRFAYVVAIVTAALAVCGLVPPLRTLGGAMPLYGGGVWLHALTAAACAWIGYGPRPARQA
jgi:ABC-type multidrug transport system permease subunit